jgi:hypothetical protein
VVVAIAGPNHYEKRSTPYERSGILDFYESVIALITGKAIGFGFHM